MSWSHDISFPPRLTTYPNLIGLGQIPKLFLGEVSVKDTTTSVQLIQSLNDALAETTILILGEWKLHRVGVITNNVLVAVFAGHVDIDHEQRRRFRGYKVILRTKEGKSTCGYFAIYEEAMAVLKCKSLVAAQRMMKPFGWEACVRSTPSLTDNPTPQRSATQSFLEEIGRKYDEGLAQTLEGRVEIAGMLKRLREQYLRQGPTNAARMLDVSVQTLQRWEKEAPRSCFRIMRFKQSLSR